MVCDAVSAVSLLCFQWKVLVRRSEAVSGAPFTPTPAPIQFFPPPSHSLRLHSKRKGIPTWYSAWLWNNSISTTGNCFTYRCRSNCSLIFVRSSPTDMFSEYIVWISGACSSYNQHQSVTINRLLHFSPPSPSTSQSNPIQSTQLTQPFRSIPITRG